MTLVVRVRFARAAFDQRTKRRAERMKLFDWCNLDPVANAVVQERRRYQVQTLVVDAPLRRGRG